MGPPDKAPIGLAVSGAAKRIARAFATALEAEGASEPVWLILMALRRAPDSSQRAIAGTVGITEATLTHHLNAMERAELVTRHRDPANRRVHVLALTAAGEETFHRLRRAVIAFDRQLRHGIDDAQLDDFRELLDQLVRNATDQGEEETR